jgi:hypothetical protein
MFSIINCAFPRTTRDRHGISFAGLRDHRCFGSLNDHARREAIKGHSVLAFVNDIPARANVDSLNLYTYDEG